jgi:hypothetical protein
MRDNPVHASMIAFPINRRPVMKYLITFNHTQGAWDGLTDGERSQHTTWLIDFMADLREEQEQELVFLGPPADTKTVRKLASGDLEVTDGPAFAGDEFIGGYYIVDVETEDDAIEWARRGRFLVGSNEVRPILEVSM